MEPRLINRIVAKHNRKAQDQELSEVYNHLHEAWEAAQKVLRKDRDLGVDLVSLIKETQDELANIIGDYEGESHLSALTYKLKIHELPETFWVVTYPQTKDTTMNDICFETDYYGFAMQVMGGLKFDTIEGLYKSEQAAEKAAGALLSNEPTV
jgi:hypothetical protein